MATHGQTDVMCKYVFGISDSETFQPVTNWELKKIFRLQYFLQLNIEENRNGRI